MMIELLLVVTMRPRKRTKFHTPYPKISRAASFVIRRGCRRRLRFTRRAATALAASPATVVARVMTDSASTPWPLPIK
jgi:hypothetical protein